MPKCFWKIPQRSVPVSLQKKAISLFPFQETKDIQSAVLMAHGTSSAEAMDAMDARDAREATATDRGSFDDWPCAAKSKLHAISFATYSLNLLSKSYVI